MGMQKEAVEPDLLLILASYWRKFHSSSPYYNLLFTPHPRFKLVEVHTPEDYAIAVEAASKAKAVFCDDHTYSSITNFQGPKFFITGDLHAFTRDAAVNERDVPLTWCDYALSTCALGYFENTPWNYFWPRKDLRNKLLYYPHHVTTDKVAALNKHEVAVGLGGEISDIVYPFRHHCSKFPEVTKIPNRKYTHAGFLEELSRYKVGITCNSFIGYNIAKYFEIPKAGSLLFAQKMSSLEQELLGFDSTNSVLITQDEAHLKLKEVLNNWHEHYAAVAVAGTDLIDKKHTALNRLNYMARLADIACSGTLTTDDAYTALRDK